MSAPGTQPGVSAEEKAAVLAPIFARDIDDTSALEEADALRDARRAHRIPLWPYVLAVAVGMLLSWIWPLGLAPSF
jgi:hypothetical protein